MAATIKLSRMDWDQKIDLAREASATPEILVLLAEDKDLFVRLSVTWNLSAPPEALLLLAKDEDVGVRRGVAGNSSAPPETLAELAEDTDWGVRQAIANNSSTPLRTSLLLAQEGHTPYGFTRGKSIDELITDIHLVDQYPETFGRAFLERLLDDPTPEDETHPKRRALIGYIYAKLAEDDRVLAKRYKYQIKALFPDDQEMAEMIGY